MNKLFTKIASLTLGLALASGAGAFIGANVEAKSASATDATIAISSLEWDDSKQNAFGSDNAVNIDTNTSFYFSATDKNTGKYYTSSPAGARLYSSGAASIVVQVASGYELTSVTIKYNVKNNGVLHNVSKATNVNNPAFPSDTAVALSGVQSVEAFIACSGTNSSYQVAIANVSVSYVKSGSQKTMKIVNSTSQEGPYSMQYGDPSGILLYAKDSDATITSGVTWTVSSSTILILDSSFDDNHCWLKPGQPGEATITAAKDGYTTVSATVTVTEGELESVAVSGIMTKTNYCQGSSWDPTGFTVTATYDTGYTKDVTSEATWEFEHNTSSTSTTSVIAYATYGGIQSSGWAQAVTVYAGSSYELTRNWETYASDWGGYATHIISGIDVDALKEALISFTNVSKQSGTITDRPVIAAKSGQTSTMTFVLDSEVAKDYTITSVEITFQRWGTKKVAAALYKGVEVSGEPLDSFAQNVAPKALTTANLNGDSFIVDFTTTESQNQQLGVSAIYIGLAEKSDYGTTDHIKVTSLPRTTYHVGEVYDSTGLKVMAYDGADESTAQYKDVTAEVQTGFTSGVYTFTDEDVPTVNMFVEYTEDSMTHTADDIVFNVYALATYELVTSAPEDWSGSYLLVSSYTDGESVEHTVAINSSLASFDQPLNFIEVSDVDGKITTGQECEFVAKTYSSGYSLQGKNGKYAYGNSSARFMTSDTEKELTFTFGEGNLVTVTGQKTDKNSYNLKLSDTNQGAERFGFYDNAESNIKLYKLTESATANAYALTFLSAFTCDDSGETEPTFNIKEGDVYWSWELLKGAYNALSNSDKELFRLGAASKAESASNISKALARYDLVVGKYGTAKYEDFMTRNPSAPKTINPGMNEISNNTNAIIAVTVIAVASISAIAVLLVIKKRKTY